jgi:ankyrin repeat protein
MADRNSFAQFIIKQHGMRNAIRAGDLQTVKELAAAHPELCSVEALHLAVTAGLTDITAVLLKPRTDIYSDLCEPVKPMQAAAAAGHHAVLGLLLQHCDRHSTEVSKWQGRRDQVLNELLHNALETADRSTIHHLVRVLLAAGAKDRLVPSRSITFCASRQAFVGQIEQHQTALATAIQQDNLKVVHQLVTAASVKALRSEYGFNAVYRAAGLQRLQALRLLLATGAAVRDPSPAQTNSVDGDVATVAIAVGKSPLVAALGASRHLDQQFSRPCWQGLPGPEPCKMSQLETACVRALIDAKADVNAQDGKDGGCQWPVCALQVAVWRGYADTVNLLLQHGASVPRAAVAETTRRLPIHVAAGGGFSDVVAALLDSGLDVDAVGVTSAQHYMRQSSKATLTRCAC